MTKKKMRWFGRVLSGVLTVCLMFSGFTAGQLIVSAGELAAYRDETVVRLKNVGSGKYLNVHYGQDANNVNVYQWTYDGTVEQTFRLRYNPEEDCYLIGAMCSSNGHGRVLDIKKESGQVQAGCNVQIYNATDPVAQQWQFAYQGDNQFTIFPMANQYTVLTANGDSNGSSGGTSATSAGNVYLSEIPMTTFVSYTDYQLWEIEEVTPLDQPIADGIYRITSGLNKYLTMDVEDNYNACHVGNPGSISGLDEMEQSQLRTYQLWDVEYLELGYYLISPATDSARKLAALGDYEMMEANVWVKPAANNGTWHQRLQWKIVPNVGGGYRIVSKGADSTQALTVAYGDTADFTNVQMSQYHGTPGQRWTFEETGSEMCTPGSVGGHAIQLTQSNDEYRYQCIACNQVFRLPQEQDYSNKMMSDERLALIFALQQTASLELLGENREHFVQACLKGADILRSECDIYQNKSVYDLCDGNGQYISPMKYDYAAQTMTASIEVSVETHEPDEQAYQQLVWNAVGGLSLPLYITSLFVTQYLMPIGDNCSLTQFNREVKEAVLEEGFGLLMDAVLPKELSQAMTAAEYAGLLNSTINSRVSGEPCISVMVRVYDGEHVDTFQGWYTIEDGQVREIHIDEENFYMMDRTLPTYTSNRISGFCSYDGVVYSPLFE